MKVNSTIYGQGQFDGKKVEDAVEFSEVSTCFALIVILNDQRYIHD